MHPSMLYEIAFNLVAIAVILRYRDRVAVPGDAVKLYLLAAGIFRFFVEFVRGNEPQALGLTGPQWVLIPLVGLLVRPLRPAGPARRLPRARATDPSSVRWRDSHDRPRHASRRPAAGRAGAGAGPRADHARLGRGRRGSRASSSPTWIAANRSRVHGRRRSERSAARRRVLTPRRSPRRSRSPRPAEREREAIAADPRRRPDGIDPRGVRPRLAPLRARRTCSAAPTAYGPARSSQGILTVSLLVLGTRWCRSLVMRVLHPDPDRAGRALTILLVVPVRRPARRSPGCASRSSATGALMLALRPYLPLRMVLTSAGAASARTPTARSTTRRTSSRATSSRWTAPSTCAGSAGAGTARS